MYFVQVEKKYTIHGDSNEILYWGREKSNFCMRLCCGSMRSLAIHVSDQGIARSQNYCIKITDILHITSLSDIV